MAQKLSTLGWITRILIVIGALNWGLVSLGYNLVDSLLGVGSITATIVYALVGLSGIWELIELFR